MPVTVLSQASAFNPGAELWILPDLEKSPWTAKLDWYLNFQISKASRHQDPKLSNFLREVEKETEQAAVTKIQIPEAPLMIVSEEHLPNKWVVILPHAENFEAWVEKISSVWTGLQRPGLRIFLPPGQNAGQLQKFWQKHQDFQEFTVVLD
jgi:hypothetical protein